jgi:hypothetical protein
MVDLPPLTPGIEIVAASEGMSKGLRQTDGVQLLVRGELAAGPLFGGGSWKNVDSATASGEAAVFVGLRGEAGGFELSALAAYKWNTDSGRQADRDTLEFVVSASRRVGPVTPRLQLIWSPDDLGGTRASLFAEAGAAVSLRPGTTLSAYAGRRERSGGTDYTAFNLGISQTIGRHVTAELRYYDTAQSALGEIYDGRAIFLVRLRF